MSGVLVNARIVYRPTANKQRHFAAMANNNNKETVLVHLHINDLRTTDSPALSLAHSQQKKHVTHFLPIYVFDERILPLDCVPGYTSSPQAKAIKRKTVAKDEAKEDEEIKPLGQEDQPSRTTTNQPAAQEREDRPKGRVGPRSRLGNFWRVGRHRAAFLVETVFDLKKAYEAKGGGMVIACGRPEEVAIKVVEALVKSGKNVEGVWTQKEVSFAGFPLDECELICEEGYDRGGSPASTLERRSGAFRRGFESRGFENNDQSQGLAIQGRGDPERVYKLPKGKAPFPSFRHALISFV